MSLFSQGGGTLLIPRIGEGGTVVQTIYSGEVELTIDDEGVCVQTGLDFPMTQGDTSKALSAPMVTPAGAVWSLSGWGTPTFTMRGGDEDVAPIIDGATAVIEGDGTTGVFRYDWASGETDTVGTFLGQFRAIDPEGEPRHFPTRGYIRIHIQRAL